VPYKPNPLKYKYLLQNSYPEISNLDKEADRKPTESGGLENPFVSMTPKSQNEPAELTPTANPFKLGDNIGEPPKKGMGAPCTGKEFGMFGMGAGRFNAEGDAMGGGFEPNFGGNIPQAKGAQGERSPLASPGLR